MNLEDQLRRLPKVNPSVKFRQTAKDRLMHQIKIQESESLWVEFLSRFKLVQPNRLWVKQAKRRLFHQIENTAPSPVSILAWLKKTTASALAMLIAVTAVLFSVGTKQPVSAADNAYLEVEKGHVEVKKADRIEWLAVTENIELTAGDLVRVADDASAVVHFFDDSVIRLADNALLLISRAESSPGFGQQGIIEVALHQGQAWVQTLNVDDEYAKLSLVTREAIVSAINSSFDVSTNWFQPTEVRVFKRSVNVQALSAANREVIAEGTLNTGEQVVLPSQLSEPADSLAALAPIEPIKELVKTQSWVAENLKNDRLHLANLKDREWIRMQAATGALPGDLLYPVKRAKERLSLALSFSDSSIADAKINMANERLTESIVLIQKGEQAKAKQVLADYRGVVDEINALAQKSKQVKQAFSNRVVASKQKVILAALPSEVEVGIVKQALDKTEELLAEDSVEKAEIQLQNALDNLANVQEFVAEGDFKSAQETLVSHDVTALDVLQVAEKLEDEEVQKALYKKLIQAQYTQRHLLTEIEAAAQKSEAGDVFAKLIENTNQKLAAGIKTTVAVVEPIIPDVVVAENTPLPTNEKVMAFIEKVNIYSTSTGQYNQVVRLLKQNPKQARDIDFLATIRDELQGSARRYVNQRMAELEKQLKSSKDRRVQLKIDRSKNLRD